MGRAGRVGLETEGIAVIMTERNKVAVVFIFSLKNKLIIV